MQEQLRNLISSGASQGEVQAMIESGSDLMLTDSGTIIPDQVVIQERSDAAAQAALETRPWWQKLFDRILSLWSNT
jgi:hypothetical protein